MDEFPIPVVVELIDKLHGACFFTKLNLHASYHQVCVHLDDVEKMAFWMHHGHIEFLVMLLGLTTAPTTFQILMNMVLWPFLRKCILVFFDDILIYNTSWMEHLQHLCAVLSILCDNQLRVKRSKCAFTTTLVAYLGHVISASGVAMDGDKVAIVARWPQPKSAQVLHGFLGLAGYYWSFIKDFGTLASPLT